jgi:very-short-patch-repair endonuclease
MSADLLRYRPGLKANAQKLRKEMTESEQLLWDRLRRKQILGVQFYRQKPIGNYIVDFFAPEAKLVIEIDGSQHMSESGVLKDKKRDDYLRGEGLLVLRFHDSEVLIDTEAVTEMIFRILSERLLQKSPRSPL